MDGPTPPLDLREEAKIRMADAGEALARWVSQEPRRVDDLTEPERHAITLAKGRGFLGRAEQKANALDRAEREERRRRMPRAPYPTRNARSLDPGMGGLHD